MRAEVIRGSPDFAKLWAGQGISAFGSAITTVAMPLVAVVALGASPLQMGVLAALTVLPHLIFGLPAGVWLDRFSRRTVLVVADVGRTLLLGSIPTLWALGLLRIEHLYVVAVLAGVLTLLSDTASMSLLPVLVSRENLVRANSASLLNQTMAATTGPSVAGALVQLIGAPITIAIDAVSFLLSAACSFFIKEPSTAVRSRPTMRWPDLTAGLREVFGDRILSPLAISATVGAIAGAMQGPLIVLYMARTAWRSPSSVWPRWAARCLRRSTPGGSAWDAPTSPDSCSLHWQVSSSRRRVAN